MKINFKRITSSGNFIPEIDGLRFIAIASVVFFHIGLFLSVKDKNLYIDNLDFSFFSRIISHMEFGVPLFFVISGFILGLPFAKFHINNELPINLKAYFFRRLTRLEPPYILVMTILLFGAVYIAKTLTLIEGIKSYIASIFYVHNVYSPLKVPFLNGVAWSLEIEIQFYILAPILAYLFKINDILNRRLIIISIIFIFTIFNYYFKLPFICIIREIHFFLIGFLLVDLYVCKSMIFTKTKIDSIIAFLLLILIFSFDSTNFNHIFLKVSWSVVQIVIVFFFYYYVIFHKAIKFLSNSIITNIGGMCYSIYLLHYPIISMLGNNFVKHKFSNYSFINVSVYILLFLIIIMFVSSVYFILIERPCMDKNWYKKMFNKNKKIL